MIWEIKPDVNNYQQLGLVDYSRDWKIATYGFDGEPLHGKWVPLRVRIASLEDDQRQPLLFGDFPGFLGAPLVTCDKALSVLKPLIDRHVEFLPLDCEDCIEQKPYVTNITTVLDCLDHERSEIERFPDGHIMRVAKFRFRADCIGIVPIFKIPEHGRAFVIDVFKSAVEQAGLKGLIFVPIADS